MTHDDKVSALRNAGYYVGPSMYDQQQCFCVFDDQDSCGYAIYGEDAESVVDEAYTFLTEQGLI